MKLAGILTNCNCTGGFGAGGANYLDTPISSYNKQARWGVGMSLSALGGATYPAGIFTRAKTSLSYFVLVGDPTNSGGFDYHLGGIPIVKPVNAMAIDAKIDDGNPMTGEVLATNYVSDDSSPYASQNRYCIYDPTQYGTPGDATYYTGYTNDLYGCKIAFEMKRNW